MIFFFFSEVLPDVDVFLSSALISNLFSSLKIFFFEEEKVGFWKKEGKSQSLLSLFNPTVCKEMSRMLTSRRFQLVIQSHEWKSRDISKWWSVLKSQHLFQLLILILMLLLCLPCYIYCFGVFKTCISFVPCVSVVHYVNFYREKLLHCLLNSSIASDTEPLTVTQFLCPCLCFQTCLV